MPRKKQKGDAVPDGGRAPQGTGKKKGRPKKVNQNRAGLNFDKKQKVEGVQYEFEVCKVWPSGKRPFVGVTESSDKDAIGTLYGSGTFEVSKKHKGTKEVVGDPMIIEIDESLYPEIGVDPAIKHRMQYQNSGSHLFGGQGWPGPQAGNYPYTPQVMPWGAQPPDGGLDTEDDGRVSELEDKIREMETQSRRDKEDEKEKRMLALIASIEAKISNPQAAQSGNSNNPLDIIRLMHEMNGPGQKTDWIQIATAAIPLMGGVKAFIADLVKSKANSTSDMSQDMLKSLMEVAEKYMSAKAQPQPAPPLNPQAPPAAPAPPPQPAGPTQDEEMDKVKKTLIENLKRMFGEAQKSQEAAMWIRDQKGPAWDVVRSEIKETGADGVVVFIAQASSGTFADNDEQKVWLKKAVEFYLNDLPVAT